MNVMLMELIEKVETLKLQAITINVKCSEIFVYDDFFFEKVQNSI